MAWRRRKDEDEDTEDEAGKPPQEPNGAELTAKRKRQADNKAAMSKVYEEISKSLSDEQKRQKYTRGK